jgi:hypothetical protein
VQESAPYSAALIPAYSASQTFIGAGGWIVILYSERFSII